MWTAGAGGKLVDRRLQAKARKHDLIRGLAESKLTTMADRISVALNDDKITEEEFRLILSGINKYNQMKAEIRGHQKQSGGLSEDEKKKQIISACDGRSDDDSTREVVERNPSWNQQWHMSIYCWRALNLRRSLSFFEKIKDRPALNELVQADISTLKYQRLAAFIRPRILKCRRYSADAAV